MRDLAIPLALLVVAAIAALLVMAFRRPPGDARWEAATELRDGVTVVFVRHTTGRRELGRQVIAELEAGLPDWENRYHEAMADARSRAAALKSEAG